jgi:restriction endonuclease S subunit
VKLPPYPRCKPSGVEWLGDVPEHWEVKRGRFTMRVNPPAPRLRALKPEDEVSFVPMEAVGVQGGLNLEQTRVLSEASSGYTEFQDGDVVVAKITPCFENGKAALARGLLNGAAYGTTELHVLRAGAAIDRSFLFYIAISDTFRKLGESEMYGAGGQKRVPPEFNKDFRTPLPPPAEQRAIAAFLERETGRVDRLVVKKRELIERLKEKRTALISRIVTRGLPPPAARAAGLPANPPLKSSALDWLGDIPAHWEVKRLSYLAMLKSGENITSEMIAEGGDYPVYGGNGLRGYYHKFTHRGHFVLIGRQGALCGNINYGNGEFWASEHALVVLPLTKFAVVWMGELLRAMNLGQYSVTAAQPGIAAEVIRGLRIPIPPLPEQAAIAAYLDLETAKLDALVGKVEEAVERLQEYRTALITAAVTGKIDVRNTAKLV